MAVSEPQEAVQGEAIMQAYVRGSALLQDLDELGLHQAAAHLSLALEVMGRASISAPPVGRPALASVWGPGLARQDS
jgi:hypothetical protein